MRAIPLKILLVEDAIVLLKLLEKEFVKTLVIIHLTH